MNSQELENDPTQNYMSLEEMQAWINQNLTPKSSVQQSLQIQEQAPSLAQRTKNDIWKSAQNRVLKTNQILSVIVNPEQKTTRLELMEGEYDQSKWENDLQDILVLARNIDAQNSQLASPYKKGKKGSERLNLDFNWRQDPLVLSIRAWKQSNMVPETFVSNPVAQQGEKTQERQNVMEEEQPEEQEEFEEPEDQIIERYIAVDQNQGSQHEQYGEIRESMIENYEVDCLQPTKEQLPLNEVDHLKSQSEIEVEIEEVRNSLEQLYLEPLDGEIELLRKIINDQKLTPSPNIQEFVQPILMQRE